MLWKKTVTICFKILDQHLPEKTEESHEKPQSGSPRHRFGNLAQDLKNAKQTHYQFNRDATCFASYRFHLKRNPNYTSICKLW
jgi:hypothetical protein